MSKPKIPKSATDTEAWQALAFDEKDSNKLEKLTKDQLSVYVSHFNLPNGLKSSPKMMAIYIKMHLISELSGIKSKFPGENFAEFKVARVKKELARMGVLPEGTFAELAVKLMDSDLFKQIIKKSLNGGGNEDANNNGSSSNGGNKQLDPILLAKEVLRRGEAGDYEGILSLLGNKVDAKSTVGEMRKAYLKLSLMIHPDKLQDYPDAKKAFQELVMAFERLSKPENFQKDMKNGGGTNNKTTLRRSNAGCMKTKVKCPRCKHEWNTPLDGNPDFAYTLMMSGIKSYCCSTCLLEFGCISALHTCPYCKKGFEYHPDDFHRQVKCGNQGCSREFGFYEDYIQDRVMKEIREQIMVDLEARMKREEAKKRRARSQQARNQLSPEEQKKQEEQAFLIGLNDLCPKCGMHLKDLEDDVDQFRHLRECTDENRHKEYSKQKKIAKKMEEHKEKMQEKQNQAQNEAVFNAFGGSNTMLWMLTDDQLKKQCQISNIDDTGSKEDMIARLAEHRKDQRAIGGNAGEVQKNDMPSNMQGMSEQAVRGVCIAQGLDPNKYESKASMINALERIKIGVDKPPQRLMLQDDPDKKKQQIERNSDDEEDDMNAEQEEDSDFSLPSEEIEKQKKREKLKNNKFRQKRFNPVPGEEYPEENQIKKKKKLIKHTNLNKNSNNSDNSDFEA